MTATTGEERVRVLIIGAGPGGISAAHYLQRRGIGDFLLLDRAEGPGGTWWHNRFPGAAVDVTSELYSFSFAPGVFSSSHAQRDELLGYIDGVVQAEGLRPRMRLGDGVRRAEWDDADAVWRVETDAGRRYSAPFLVSAVGMLTDPREPALPGRDRFRGKVFHTSQWPEGLDLAGQRVAVIGTGSTSAQVVPALAPDVAQLFLFQRQPGWVLPKDERPYTAAEKQALLDSPLRQRWRRLRAFLRMERTRGAARENAPLNREMEARARSYLQQTLRDPEKHAAARPDYPFGRKRPLLSSTFLPALARENVTVVPRAVTDLSEAGVIDSSGAETPVDAVVLATGFKAESYLSTLQVRGRDGVDLHRVWNGEPTAFLGLMTPGFPNFFMMYGPNTNGGTILYTLEAQGRWIARAVDHARRRQVRSYDLRPAWHERADRIMQKRNRRFAWASGDNNYYTSGSGKVVTQWPFTQTSYALALGILPAWRCCIVQTAPRAASQGGR